MDLRDYLDILRARWILITVVTLTGVIAAAVVSMLATPLYQSCTTQFVSAQGSTGGLDTAYTGQLFSQQRIKSYVDAVTSTPVMQAVASDLNLSLSPAQIANQIDVSNPLDTVNLKICATDPSPEQAQSIAVATANQFKTYVGTIEVPLANGKPLIKISGIDDAPLPTTPVSPRTAINIALGFLVGLAVGVGAAVLLETLDTRIKTVEALLKHFDHPLLGVIAYDTNAAKHPLIVQDPSQSKRAESFRQLRTNLQFVDIDHRPRSIVVTSSIPQEGKSTTAINLAVTIAQSGQTVFLIEGDLRRPKVSEYLGIEGAAGLTDLLVGRASVDDVIQPWGTTGNLWLLAAGPLPPNPSELLGSQAMADLIHDLEQRATLIIDAPPLLPVTDAAVLTKLTGGAIVIVRSGKTRREQLRTAESTISGVGGRILGLVMNMTPIKGLDSTRYGYGYGYDYSGPKGDSMGQQPPVSPASQRSTQSDAPVVSPEPNRTSEHTGSVPEPEVLTASSGSPPPSETGGSAPGLTPDGGSAAGSTLEQSIPSPEKVIGHSVRVPLPAPTASQIGPLEPESDAFAGWTPPRPRPAFDPLTAPIGDVKDGES